MNTLTWLGHAAFRIDTSGGKRLYIDPFLTGNPKLPEGEGSPERVDIIAVTHGHSDHVGDAVALDIRLVDDIPLTRAGKLQVVVSTIGS